MSFSYDLGTDVGKIRLLIMDNDSSNALFQDEEISAMQSMKEGDLNAAGAGLLYAMAASKSLCAKAISAGKYSEDSRNVPDNLRKAADALLAGSITPWDGVIEQTFEKIDDNMRRLTDPNTREFINKEYIRGEEIL